MSHSNVNTINHTVEETQLWLNRVQELGGYGSTQEAYSAFRAALHALRDRIPMEETMKISAQVPMLIRGLLFEGWKPLDTPTKQRTLDDFFNHVRSRCEGLDLDPQPAVTATFTVLNEKLTGDLPQNVRKMLPEPVRELWLI